MNRESLHRESNRKPPGEISTFEDLEVYVVAREFRKAMYCVAKRLPDIEKFGLASQIRRAALSLTNNIAEGHGRYHYLEQIRFTLHSRGSLQELVDDLNVCEDEHYLSLEEIVALKEDGWRVRQLIDGYVRYLRQQNSRIRDASVREESSVYNEDTTIHNSRFNGSRLNESQ
jgi:four helix bundle protein